MIIIMNIVMHTDPTLASLFTIIIIMHTDPTLSSLFMIIIIYAYRPYSLYDHDYANKP